LLELIQKHCTLKSYNVVAKWHIRIYDCLEKEEYENQKVKRKTNRSRPTKQNKIKARYKTKPKKKHNKSQTQNKSFDSVGRTVERGFRRASSSYHSSLILLYIVIPFKLAESRRV
jgi:hypothetical protein